MPKLLTQKVRSVKSEGRSERGKEKGKINHRDTETQRKREEWNFLLRSKSSYFAGRESPAELLSFSVRRPKKKKHLLFPLPLCLRVSVVNFLSSSSSSS
jgi:hypothetical protein